MRLHTRDASASDAEALSDAHAEAWRVGYADLYDSATLDEAIVSLRASWAEYATYEGPRRATLLLLEVDGEVAGFVNFAADGTEGEIYRFYLHPSAWGSGGAQLLVDDAVARLSAEGVTTIRLWTHRGAARARRFYEKAGFVLSGREQQDEVHGATCLEVEYRRSVS